MLLTEKFVYIHYPKTGGTFVTEMLQKIYASKGYGIRYTSLVGLTLGKNGWMINTARYREGMAHTPCRRIPVFFKNKPIFATIRNPYDLYVSEYEYAYWKINPQKHFSHSAEEIKKIYPNFPNITFTEYVNLLNLEGFNQIELPLLKQPLGWHSYRRFIGMFFKKPKEEICNAMDEDYISYLKFKEDMYPVTFIKKENLNQELYDFLVKIGYPSEKVNFILQAKKVLPWLPSGGERRSGNKWEKYYTPELKRFVRTRERLLFSMFPEYDV